MTKVWRVYNNGSVKNDTNTMLRYGCLEDWADYNEKWRFGCAQISQHEGEDPKILYVGYLDEDRLQPFLEKIKKGEIQ